MQASLEAEAKGKAEALRIKKKLESDINELEIALDHSNKANSDLNKHIKKLTMEIKDLELRAEEEQRLASEYREQYGIAERRAEQEHAHAQEKMKKGLEVQVKELQARLEEAEGNALKANKKQIATLEVKVRELELSLDDESHRHADAQKNLRKCERRIKV